jgi:hypothetical protein
MNPTLTLVTGLAWLATVAGSYIYGMGVGQDIEIATQAREDKIVHAVSVAMTEKAASAIAGISFKNTTIRQTLESKTREVPYPVDCRLQLDVLRLLNSTPGIAPAASAAGGG